MANAMMLLFAGFDNIGVSISQVLHNLVKNDEIQERLCEEIDDALDKSDGEISYDLIERIPYLDWVIKEALR